MEKMIGSVDHLGRPVLQIEGKNDHFLVLVDTGFNGDLLVTEAASRALGAIQHGLVTTLELGDGSRTKVLQARATIPWIERNRVVKVFIAKNWHPTGDNPVGLLGTALIAPHRLVVDFDDRTLEISAKSAA
jgi:predicted aspartyl protease